MHYPKALALLAVLFFSTSAWAIPTLRISDGTNTLLIADGDLGDSSGDNGSVGYSGLLGDWSVSLVAVTFPIAGNSTDNPFVGVTATSLTGGTGTLYIDFSVDNFGPTFTGFNQNIDATTDGTGTMMAGMDPANLLFWADWYGGENITTGHFANTSRFGAIPSLAENLYAITIRAAFTHGGAGDVTNYTHSVDLNATVPDGSSTFALLIPLFIAMVAFRSRR